MLKDCGDINITPSINRLHDLMSIFDFHQILPPDELHTFVKGPIEYCVLLGMLTIYLVNSLDKEVFGSNVAILDQRISNFEITQSLQAIRMKRFAGGVSQFFLPQRVGKGHSKLTGNISGGLAGWMLKSMLLQLQISIGFEGIIVPKEKSWCNGKRFSEKWSISDVLQNAFSSTIEVMFALAKNHASIKDINYLEYLIYLNQAHILRLQRLSKELQCNEAGDALPSKAYEFGGIKLHMMTHFPYYRYFYGCPSFLFDMELPEHSHLKTKLAFERTSKIYDYSLYEMAKVHSDCLHADLLSKRAVGITNLSIEPTVKFTFSVSKKVGAASGDTLQFQKEKFVYTGEGQPRGLHPLLNMTDLTRHLERYLDESSKDDIGGNVLYYIQHPDANITTTCKLLYQLNCSGNDDFSIAPFILYSDNSKLYGSNRKKHKSNRQSIPTFSFFEAEYKDSIEVVRIMAIISLRGQFNVSPFDFKEQYVVVVAQMKVIEDRGIYKELGYNYSHRTGLIVDVVDIECLRLPACVFLHPDDYKSATERVGASLNDKKFYQVPGTRLVDTESVLSYDEIVTLRGSPVRSDIGLYMNFDELNEYLTLSKENTGDIGETSDVELADDKSESDVDDEEVDS